MDKLSLFLNFVFIAGVLTGYFKQDIYLLALSSFFGIVNLILYLYEKRN